MKNLNLNIFCTLPWTRLQLSSDGGYRPCCKYEGSYTNSDGTIIKHPQYGLEEVWNSPAVNKLRMSFLNNEKPKECKECYIEEEAGGISLRQENIIDLINLNFINDCVSPKSLDIKLSNLCNLKCRICGPSASSVWEAELRQKENFLLNGGHNQILNKNNLYTIKKWLPSLKKIEVFGGETLLNPEFYDLLNFCKKSNFSEGLVIHCNSNGTIFNKKIIDYANYFKKISVYFSIDDIFKRFTYQRHPASFHKVEANLLKYKKFETSKTNFGINCTVSIFNVFYLPEFIEWSKKFNWHVFFNILHLPEYFSISCLPRQAKKIIRQRLMMKKYLGIPGNCDDISKILNLLKSEPEANLFDKATQEIKKIDLYRGESFKKFFPEFYRLITN